MAIGIGRATVPAEFYDRTSAKMLRQPEPQYFHARLIKNALATSLPMDVPAGLPISGRDMPSGGADVPSVDVSRLMLSDDIYAEAVEVVNDFTNASVGHTIHFNRPRFVNSTYTQVSRALPVGTAISTTPTNVGEDQVPLTIQRFGGPYDNAQSAVAPLALERFDLQRSVHDLVKFRGLHLVRDFDKTLDAFGVALFDLSDSGNIIWTTGMTADNDSTQAGDFPMDWATLKRVETKQDTLSIPYFANGRRLVVLTPLQCEQLDRDPEFQRLARYEKDLNPLYAASYVKTAGKFDIFKSITLSHPNNTNSIPIQYGQAFGPGMVGVGQAAVPRVVPNTNDNYGETALVIWLWYACLGVLDSRFGCSVRSS